ncbi:MerR family transcriptional regulator [Hanamia caeni]|uniref:MerR family transcriptional regulator n=1 Tax=Hanamia caeni TaxID=2294116 RepID=A0A3M9ND87_9BACT|nr:MerR family transcriptional regulator [Hanamia caeni]RNI35734.1 MerR family transcriptional regulator [Hanamia caeni]
MNLFSISQLSNFSGIKPHTIRIWEQRYNALSPGRSEGNTRYYDNDQLRRLLNIVSLVQANYKISEISTMSDKKLFELLEQRLRPSEENIDTHEYFILQLIAAGMNFDEINFDKLISHCLVKYGVEGSYLKVIYPMLKRIGLMWATNLILPAAEHFISNIIRQKLFTLIDSLPAGNDKKNSWLLFLPENEFHEIGLLFSHYLIRKEGFKSVYLGSNVPLQSVVEAAAITNPDNLLLFLTHNDSKEVLGEYMNDLGRRFKNKNIKIAADAKQLQSIKLNKNFEVLSSMENLQLALSEYSFKYNDKNINKS